MLSVSCLGLHRTAFTTLGTSQQADLTYALQVMSTGHRADRSQDVELPVVDSVRSRTVDYSCNVVNGQRHQLLFDSILDTTSKGPILHALAFQPSIRILPQDKAWHEWKYS